LFSQISDFNFLFAQNYMLGAIACQIRVAQSQQDARMVRPWRLAGGFRNVSRPKKAAAETAAPRNACVRRRY
jgi:hypothetical protein